MPEHQMEPIEAKVIFLCEGRPATARDVLDAAFFRGELQPMWRELLRLLAAEHHADEQNLEFDDDAIDTAVERFRYGRDLITAEETEKWLGERGLTLSDFSAHFVRHYWGEQFAKAESEELDCLEATPETRKLFVEDLILSGELDQLAQQLSWRLAGASAAREVPADPEIVEKERAAFFERVGIGEDELAHWLERLGREQAWWEEMLAMEAIYRRDRAALLSQQARIREIAALRLPLTRFEVETIELDSLDAAREALLCARDDGMSMEEVAAEGRYPYRQPQVLLEEIPEDLQQKFLSVHPGEILEPIAHGDGFHLCRIIGKAEPDVEDPVVQERADQRIFDRHFSDLTTRFIQWRLLLA